MYLFNDNKMKKGIYMTGMLKNIKSRLTLKNILLILIPPVSVAVILLCTFALGGLYPFGEKTLAWCDMHQQVLPLMLDFKDMLSGKDNFFLSMHNAGGMNFIGVFFFFISSPFTFLTVFIDKAQFMNFMNILTVIKMCLCSVTMMIWLKVTFKRLMPFLSIALSVVYAFCGYAMLFYQNSVWLDVMCFFPILLLSIQALLKKGKMTGYIICLVCMLALNYYLSYMVVIFIVLYVGVYLFFHRKRDNSGSIAFKFILSSFTAALLSAVVWLPALAQYFASARGGDIIAGLLSANLFTQVYTNLPFLLCSSLLIAIVIVFAGRRENSLTKQYLILIVLTLLPVIIEPVNKMWHTGDYMSFPVRYGYITIAMLIAYGGYKLSKLKKEDFAEKSNLIIMLPVLIITAGVGVISVWYYITYRKDLDAYSTTLWGDETSFTLIAIMSLIFLGLFMAYLMLEIFRKSSYRIFSIGIGAVIVFECFFSANVYIGAAAYKPTQYNSVIQLADKIEDDSFYRVKTGQDDDKLFDANLMGGLGYNTISHYTSLTYENYMFAMKRFGYSSYWMEVSGSGGTELTDALLSIKYSVEKFDPTYKNPIYTNGEFSITETGYSLPLGLITDTDLSQYEKLTGRRRKDIQELLAETLLSSKENICTTYEYTELFGVDVEYVNKYYYILPNDRFKNHTITYQIYVDGRETLYFDAFDKVSRALNEHINNTFNIYVNGKKLDYGFPSKDSNGLLCLGTYENEGVLIEIDVNESAHMRGFGVFGMDLDKLDYLIENAKTADLKVSGNKITGSATATNEGQYLFLSIPYDKGFKVSINGQEAELLRCMGGFSAIRLFDGENAIEISYTPSGFNLGLIITITGIVLFAVVIILRNRLNKIPAVLGKLSKAGVYLLFAVVITAIYLMPLALSITGNLME